MKHHTPSDNRKYHSHPVFILGEEEIHNWMAVLSVCTSSFICKKVYEIQNLLHITYK